MPSSFTRIHHVGIVVRNLEKAYGFWRDTLQLAVSKTAVVPDQGVSAALLPCGESEIELLEPVNENGGVAKFLEKRGEGLHHVCFQTDDVSGALKEAEAKGIPLIDKAPRKGLAGMIGFLHPKANHGTLVEYATPFPEDAPPELHPPQGPFIRLHTAGVAVNDESQASAVFGAHFDLPCAAKIEDAARGVRVAFHPVGRAVIALMAPSGAKPAALLARRLEKSGEGLFLIGIEVSDFTAAAKRLENAGLTVTRTKSAGGLDVGLVGPEGTNNTPIEFYKRPTA
ncbi:MAG: methylmalonyl-CoA epimerase [Deltaproteobacteria bacterium]|nr:methylmalonyl-CoA epimerase [Deltaproteobacteria bacterium]